MITAVPLTWRSSSPQPAGAAFAPHPAALHRSSAPRRGCCARHCTPAAGSQTALQQPASNTITLVRYGAVNIGLWVCPLNGVRAPASQILRPCSYGPAKGQQVCPAHSVGLRRGTHPVSKQPAGSAVCAISLLMLQNRVDMQEQLFKQGLPSLGLVAAQPLSEQKGVRNADQRCSKVEATNWGHAAGLAGLSSSQALATKLLAATDCVARQAAVLSSTTAPSPARLARKPGRACKVLLAGLAAGMGPDTRCRDQ